MKVYFMIKSLKINFIKFSIFFIVLICLLFSLSYQIFAQASGVEVQRSTEKALINGKVYYIHVVKKGETLYSIAKAYSVSVADITSSNPDAVYEIKTDQVLRIPVAAMHKVEVVVKKNDEQILHVVAAGQTLYSISRIYGVTVADIEKLNPEVKIDSIQINQVLKIPALPKKENNQNPENSKTGFVIHKVIEKETIYSLSKQFGIDKDTLLKYNQSVSKEGLKAGQDLLIPTNNQNQILNTIKSDSSTGKKIELTPVKINVNCDSLLLPVFEKKIQVSLLLPLFSSGNNSNDAETNDENQNEEKAQLKQPDEFLPLSAKFMEFYQGVLLALDNLKNKGLQVNLYVFDTEKSTAKTEEILKNSNFQKSNLIIGPVFGDQIKIVADYALKNGIYIISPMACNEKLLHDNPMLFQINPGKSYEIEADLNLLKPDTSKNTIAVYKSDTANIEQNKEFKQYLANKFGKDTLHIKVVNVNNNDFSNVKEAIDSLHENIIISPVADEIFVTDLLGTLESKLIDNRISVIGMHDWINYSGIDLNYFYDLQMTFNTPFYSDYTNIYTIDFLKKYQLFFGTEPAKYSKFGFNYSMMGYDIASFFITAFYNYGKDFTKYLPCIKNNAIVAPFNFIQISPLDGYTNTYQHLVKYSKDYTIDINTSSNK